jgi:myogenesis-regulating glycosidase
MCVLACLLAEFLLGEDYLVAPVLVKGAVARDIYLPEGAWSEGFHEDNGQVHNGPVWLRNHPAPLNHLPFFQRL